MGIIFSKYSQAQGRWNDALAMAAARMVKTMGGWPPDPIWMRKYAPWIILMLALPVFVSARQVLRKQFGGSANNLHIQKLSAVMISK